MFRVHLVVITSQGLTLIIIILTMIAIIVFQARLIVLDPSVSIIATSPIIVLRIAHRATICLITIVQETAKPDGAEASGSSLSFFF